MKLLRNCLGILLVMTFMTAGATDRKKLNFNGNWRLAVGDMTEASLPNYDDSRKEPSVLPSFIRRSSKSENDWARTASMHFSTDASALWIGTIILKVGFIFSMVVLVTFCI